jgi:hypothetical protein
MYLHMNEINYFVQCAKQRRNRNIYILRGHGSGVRSPQWLWLRAKADNRAMPSLLAEFFSACLKIFWKVKYVFDCELANAVQGITLSLKKTKLVTFAQFKAYYVMSDMK